MMSIDLYPDTRYWATNHQICPNPNVRTIKDCHDDWHCGHNGGPPLKLLEQKYQHRWRKKQAKIAKRSKYTKPSPPPARIPQLMRSRMDFTSTAGPRRPRINRNGRMQRGSESFMIGSGAGAGWIRRKEGCGQPC
mmetsp:Transcript_140953/g.342430  ORF Transcript_140953/g.342430 Transcript_140953/m.342430 type:complete len:135 (-) Transcript_140953:200-604(-)